MGHTLVTEDEFTHTISGLQIRVRIGKLFSLFLIQNRETIIDHRQIPNLADILTDCKIYQDTKHS